MTETKKLAQISAGLDASTSPVSRTLEQLYTNHKDLSYAFWNDEHPDGKKVPSPHAHAKGVVAFDGQSGFWLTHSLPSFPGTIRTGRPDYDTPSDKYGQSYLCITIDKAAFEVLNQLAMVNRYSLYDAADNAKMGGSFTTWAVDEKYGKDTSLVTTLKSAGGQSFTAFAKSWAWNDELYESLVAPKFNADFYTETWQNGRGKVGSYCHGKQYDFDVMNVQSVNFPGHNFDETQDHSKWAVSANKGDNYFCVGDINRQEGQFNRGGGTICITSKSFADQMNDVVDEVEVCRKAEAILV
jgi:deoxyribonuclease-2